MPDSVSPPSHLCILRLSAIGDTCHVVPIVRTLQHAWPATRITWVIGRVEARLLGLLPDVEFITVDKRAGWRAFASLRAALQGRRFDVLLHMQLALRASLLSLAIRAERRIGYDWARARELQWLFCNERIPARRNEHVQDCFFGFTDTLGLTQRQLDWRLPLPEAARTYAARLVPDAQPTLVVSPCSSHALRNWSAERYAAVIRHAVQRHAMRVILCGSPSDPEREFAARIVAAAGVPLLNQVGRDTLPELLALLGRATVLLTPDSGPAHMGTLASVPVIGLYAATRLARSGPYCSREWCVDAYAEAAQRFRGRPAAALPWTEKIEEPGVMELIDVAAVTDRLDALLAHRG
ncbi:MAG: glycosyltransferase family 9 protein [Gammaproteobacteria bacterium]|nr:glycosyltransferase family 9 protein [Gammaproteobacteria bacterium]